MRIATKEMYLKWQERERDNI